MTWLSYRSAIDDFERNALSEMRYSNNTVADTLRRKIALIGETERNAVEIMNSRLDRGVDTQFVDIAKPAADGAYHTPDDLWDGREVAGGVRISGLGGFFPPPVPAGPRRDAILAAFETVKAMAGGLTEDIESLYFFSPFNDLLIYAPNRPDELVFYRQAPQDFDFQDAEFSQISQPGSNPEGRLRCTGLQNPAYDDSGEIWTTGCMTPMRRDGIQLGVWGVSIPLRYMTEGLRSPPGGAFTIIFGADGRLIHHSEFSGKVGNLDLSQTRDPLLSGLWRTTVNGEQDAAYYSDKLDAQIVTEKLVAPDWYVVTAMPQSALGNRAWNIARRVILVAVLGTLVLSILLVALFHRAVARRITRLARRADRVSAATARDETGVVMAGDEIDRLEGSFTRMEKRLDQAEERNRRSFDMLVDAAAGYAMLLFDAEGRLLRANIGAERLLGKSGIDRLESALARRCASEADGATQSELPGEATRIVQQKSASGSTVSLEEAMIPLKDEDGDVFAFAYVAHDLTAIKANERKLEESLLFLELAQASAKAGHFSLDPATMEISVSNWIREKFGIEEPVMPVGRAAEYFSEATRERTMQDIFDAIAAKGEFAFEAEALTSDGAILPVAIRGTAAFEDGSEESEPIGYFGIIRDIAEERESEMALIGARDAAQGEAQARSDLLAVVSHEIRTPISGILGLIDQIRRERSPDERQKALGMIEASSEALLETLDATLQQRRLEREEVDSSQSDFRLSELVERVAGLFRPLARRKGLSIEVETTSENLVRGNPGRIQQILANLVSNAVKFTSIGRVTVHTVGPVEGSDIWTVHVDDTGPGIPTGRLETIFAPFAGSDPDTLGRKSGSGLGLSIAHGLVEEMCGDLTAANRDSGGARMTMRLPLPAGKSEEIESARGHIAIMLKQASLGLQAEVAAMAEGFWPADPSAAADVLVSDDRAAVQSFVGKLAILVSDNPEHAEEVADDEQAGPVRIVTDPAELLGALPGMLRELDDR